MAEVRKQKREAQEAALEARKRAVTLRMLTSPAVWKRVGKALLDNAAQHNARRMGVRGPSVENAGVASTGAEGAISPDAMAADAAGAAIEQEVVAMSAAERALENEISALGNMLSGMGVKGGRRTRRHGRKTLRRRKNKSRKSRN